VTKPTRLPAPPAIPAAEAGCPFRLRGHCQAGNDTQRDEHSCDEARYIQVRRQGLYLAACIVDDVAALGITHPQAVIDEIRRRLCELVRYDLGQSNGG
jgi:hypothetical protein